MPAVSLYTLMPEKPALVINVLVNERYGYSAIDRYADMPEKISADPIPTRADSVDAS